MTGEASGDKELINASKKYKEEILGNNKYDKQRAQDRMRFNLSPKEQRLGAVAEAIGRGGPAAALMLIPGVGPVLAAVYVGVSSAGQSSRRCGRNRESRIRR